MYTQMISCASFTNLLTLNNEACLISKRQVLKVCLCNRLLVEKIFAQCMVPHSLETEEKMKCLYYLYACLDTNAVK